MRYLTREELRKELSRAATEWIRHHNRVRIDGKGRPRPPTAPRKYAKPANEGERYVYVIGPMQGQGAVKIGVALSPKKRLKALQTGHPEALKLHYAYPVPVGTELKIERQCHEHFRASRIKGEWFQIDPKDAVDLVRTLGRQACADAQAALAA